MSPEPRASLPATDGADRLAYVVDDHSDVRRTIHFSLSTIGIIARSFASAQDFLEQVQKLPPAPVLLDFRMPEMDGLEALAILRSRAIDWPVIMMLGHGDISVAVQAIKLGAMDFIEKPFNFERLEFKLLEAYNEMVHTISF